MAQTIGLAVALIAGFVIALLFAAFQNVATPNPGFDPTGALVFITGAAVAIERVIEGFWGLVNTKLPWWPMSALAATVKDFETKVNGLTAGTFDELDAALKDAVEAMSNAGDDFVAAQSLLEDFRATTADAKVRLQAIKKLGPGNERLQLLGDLATETASAADAVMAKTGTISANALSVLGTASSYGNTALDIVGSFKENPARRIISLVLGATMGLFLAGLFGLNLFVAAEQAPPTDDSTAQASAVVLAVTTEPTSRLEGAGGIVLTGIILGLGSGPTHEVIRLVQEAKRNRRQPVAPAASGGQGEAATAPAAHPRRDLSPRPASSKESAAFETATEARMAAAKPAAAVIATPATPVAPRLRRGTRLQSTE